MWVTKYYIVQLIVHLISVQVPVTMMYSEAHYVINKIHMWVTAASLSAEVSWWCRRRLWALPVIRVGPSATKLFAGYAFLSVLCSLLMSSLRDFRDING